MRPCKSGDNKRHLLSLIHIGLGEFEKAMEDLRRPPEQGSSLEVPFLFNLAMAKWGHDGSPPREHFRLFLQRFAERDFADANSRQCQAIALWAVGERERAWEALSEARESAGGRVELFSCWTFLQQDAQSFLNDLEDMSRLFDGEAILPSFMR